MDWQYLDLADFLLIAEAVLDLPAEDLSRAGRLDLADAALHAPAAEFGGVEFYPDLARKTAVLASRLIRNHPLPDGNKRVGYLCALEFVAPQRRDVDLPARRPRGGRDRRHHRRRGRGRGRRGRAVRVDQRPAGVITRLPTRTA